MKERTLLGVYVYVIGFVAVPTQTSSPAYETILTTSTFVDKTLLIKILIESKQFTLITAPPKFGKSTILNMLKTFLEIEVSEDGVPKTNVNYTADCVTDTKNFKLFEKCDLKIMKHQSFIDEHFGRTPVIGVDFKVDDCDNAIQSLYDAVRFCKQVVHKSFKDHEYLLYSDKLTDDHKRYVQMWCDDHSFKTMVDTVYVSHALQSLAQYLHQHFNGRRVFVLVDNQDSIIRNATFYAESVANLNEIINYTLGIIKDVLKGGNEFLCGAFITGISEIPVLSHFGIIYITTYKFLGDHQYFDFFGLTRKEVDSLLNSPQFNVDPREVEILHSYYNGYQNKRDRKIYNLYSFLMFLKTGKMGNYFTQSSFPTHIKYVYDINSVNKDIEKLLRGEIIYKDIPVNITVQEHFKLSKSLRNHQISEDLWGCFFSILLEWGFLTYSNNEGESIENVTRKEEGGLKIPNGVIKEFLIDQWKASKT